MDMASRTRSVAVRLGLGACAALALAPLSAEASALETYYERALISVADARCRLFEPGISAALAAGAAQARGAALRSGEDEDQVALVGDRARTKAYSQSCQSADLAAVATRVRDGYKGFASLIRMDYPGDVKSWAAIRMDSTTGRIWNLSQNTTFGRDTLTFGITHYNGSRELIAVTQFADGASPSAARLIMRDRTLSRRAYLDPRTAAGGKIPLTGRVTPRSVTRTFLADMKFTPGPLLKPAGKTPALAYRFPAAAAAALAELDPREAIEIEFSFADGSRRTALIEVGDFAAGRAFLLAAQR